MELLSEQATPPPHHQIVASVIRGQCATRGVGPVCGQTDRRVKHQEQRSPSPKMIPYRCVDIVKACGLLLISGQGFGTFGDSYAWSETPVSDQGFDPY